MVQATNRARLAEEGLTSLGGSGEIARKDLDRHRSGESYLTGQVDDAHAPATQLAVERVFAGERDLQGELCDQVLLARLKVDASP
jgi:hypothetical protein